MRLRFLSLVLFALLSGPLGWVSQARVHVQNLGGFIASVAQLPGARFVRWVDARGLSLGERERVDVPFSRWEPQLWSGIIRMSGRLNTFGPVSGAGTVLQEYLDPTNPRGPRIDLENLRGINLRQ